MEQAVAYWTLALTVGLAVGRPRIRGLRFTPGIAAVVGVVLLFVCGILTVKDMVASAALQWRPLLALTSVMVMTGVVEEVGAFARLAERIEAHARRTSASRAFGLVFLVSVVTPSLLNNDAAILLLTPLVVALTRRLWPGREDLTLAFAFVVFLAPGVAPFVISNPMNMIVAEFAGVSFNAYAKVMAPISLAGALLTFVVLRVHYRKLLAGAQAGEGTVTFTPAHPAERPALALLLAIFAAYPLMAAVDGPIWIVSLGGAVASVVIARRWRVAPMREVLAHVSPDILVFLWGVFLVVVGLRHVGVVDKLADLFAAQPAGSARQVAVVGTVAALGSAIVDNHPMSILDMLALEGKGARPLLAALVGGDVGPRLLPIGSLAGLLWMDLLRRAGIEVGIGKFVRLGTLVLVPTLVISLALLALLT